MTPIKDDEIDLFQLAGRIFSRIKQRKALVFFFTLLGLACGIGSILQMPGKYKPYYQQEFVIRSSVVTDGILSDIVNNLSLQMDSVAGFRKIEAKLQVNASKESKLKLIVWADEESGITSVKNALALALDTMSQLREKYLEIKKGLDGIAAKYTGQESFIDSLLKLTRVDSAIQANLEMLDIGKQLAAHKILEFIDIASPVVYESNLRSKTLAIVGYMILGFVIGVLCAYYAPKAVAKI